MLSVISGTPAARVEVKEAPTSAFWSLQRLVVTHGLWVLKWWGILSGCDYYKLPAQLKIGAVKAVAIVADALTKYTLFLAR